MIVRKWLCKIHGIQETRHMVIDYKDVSRCVMCGGLLDEIDGGRREEIYSGLDAKSTANVGYYS